MRGAGPGATTESGEKQCIQQIPGKNPRYTAEFNVYSRIEGEAPKKRNFDTGEVPKKRNFDTGEALNKT